MQVSQASCDCSVVKALSYSSEDGRFKYQVSQTTMVVSLSKMLNLQLSFILHHL